MSAAAIEIAAVNGKLAIHGWSAGMRPRHVCCLYSPTHAGKSSLLGTAARWMWAKHGLRTRLYSADGGGWGPMQDLVDDGIIDAYDPSIHIHPFETVRQCAQGAWPTDKADPKSPLAPLWLLVKKATCAKCATSIVVKDAVPGATCAACKGPLVITGERVANPKNPLHEGFGLVFYEGLTAFCDLFMDDMSGRSAAGEKIGEDVAVRFTDGDEKIAAASRSSYGIAQRRAKDAVEETRHLPVPYVVWTALEDKGTDDLKRVPVYGPKLAGHAATDDAPRWFGPTLYLAVVPIPSKPAERRLYTTTAFLPGDDTPHVAGTRVPPVGLAGIEAYYVYKPESPTLLGDVIEAIENGHAKAKALTADLRAKHQGPVAKVSP